MLAEELFSRDLRNRRQVGALCGLVSAPYQSGTRQHDQGLIGSGLPAIRRIAVEIAWAWVRFQPQSALTQWYQTRFGGGRRRGAPHRHRRARAAGHHRPLALCDDRPAAGGRGAQSVTAADRVTRRPRPEEGSRRDPG